LGLAIRIIETVCIVAEGPLMPPLGTPNVANEVFLKLVTARDLLLNAVKLLAEALVLSPPATAQWWETLVRGNKIRTSHQGVLVFTAMDEAQIAMNPRTGNCWVLGMDSVLDLTADAVPTFLAHPPAAWLEVYNKVGSSITPTGKLYVRVEDVRTLS
jgi:hypothetical protein